MKKLFVVVLAAIALAGCQGRAIWNDNGELEDATTNREVWDSNGKMDTDGRKIWHDSEGNPVVQ